MIERGTRLYPEVFDSSQMYYQGQPFAYWLSVPEYNFCEWILYKEYNDYTSVCNPNDCLAAVSHEELMREFKTFSYYENMDREMLCRTFRQRSLDDNPYEFEDFIDFEA